MGEPVVAFPYPERYGGTIGDEVQFKTQEDDGMMAFGFDHNQAQATLVANEAEKQV